MKRLLNLLVFSLLMLVARGQNVIDVKTWALKWPRGGFDSALYVPTGCGVPSGIASLQSYGVAGSGQIVRMAAIFFDSCGHQWYGFDPTDSSWALFGSGSGGGIDSLKRKAGTDSIFAYTHGTPTFQFKDTATLATILASLGYAPLAASDTNNLSHRIDTTVARTAPFTTTTQGIVTPTGLAHNPRVALGDNNLFFPVVTPGDTSGKWVGFIKRSNDSIYYCKGNGAGGVSCTFAFMDSIGMVNFGGAPGALVGTNAGIPAATSYLTGTLYIANDSGFIYLDTGSGGTRGWKNLTAYSVGFRGLGQPGDTSYVSGSGSNIYVAARRDSGAFHTFINPDGSRTSYVAPSGSTFDSLSTQGGGFHTDGFNQVKYKQAADSNNSTNSYASVGRLNKKGDSVAALLSNRWATFIPLYQKGYWKDGSDFTITGMTPTYSADSLIVLPGVAANYSQYMTINGLANNDENTVIQVIFKLTAAPGSGMKGLSIGWKSFNTWYAPSFAAGIDLTYNSTLLRMSDGLGSTGADSIGGFVAGNLPSSGDYISLFLMRTGNTMSLTYYDITANTTPVTLRATANLQASGAGVNWQLPNSSNFCIWNHQAVSGISIVSIRAYSMSDPSPNVMCVGDSKTSGNGQQSNDMRWPGRIRSLGSVDVMAGGGDRTVETVQDTAYIFKYFNLKGASVILNIGRNDLGSSVASGTWQANYASLVTSFTYHGATVIHLLPIPETNTSQTTLTSWINSNYSGNKIDVSPTWNNTTDLAADNIHPTPLGGALVGAYVLNSGLIPYAVSEWPRPFDYITQVASASVPSNLVYLSPGSQQTGFINTQFIRIGASPAAALANGSWITASVASNVMFGFQNTINTGYSGFNFVDNASQVNAAISVGNSLTSDPGNLTFKTISSTQNIDFYGGNGVAKGTSPDFRINLNGEVQINTKVEHSAKLQINGAVWLNKDSVATSSAGSVMAVGIDTPTNKLVKFTAGAGTFYQTVQSNTTSQTQRAKLNFGPMFTLADNSGNGSTDVNTLNAIATDGSAPSISAGGAIPTGGGGATYSFSSGSNAVKGKINLTTGTGSGSGTQVFTITLPAQPAGTNYQVFLQDLYSGTHINLIPSITSSTQFSIYIQDSGTLAASTSYIWSYYIVN